MKRPIFLCAMLMSFFTFNLKAETVNDNVNGRSEIEEISLSSFIINGYTRGVFYGGSSDYNYSTLFGETAISGSMSIDNAYLYTDIRAREGIRFDERVTELQVKEAYAGYSGGFFNITIGNKIVVWGRADGFNPTDNITPKDHFFLSGNFDDQRLSNFIAKTTFRLQRNTGLTIIAIPVFRQSIYHYHLFDMGENVSFLPALTPDISFNNSGVAVKLDMNLRAVDLSISYFNGYDVHYGFNVDTIILIPEKEIKYRPAFYRKSVAGIDFSAVAGRTIMRAEAAFTTTQEYYENMHIPNPDISYVAGFEREAFGTTTVLQYIGKYTLDYDPLIEPAMPPDPTDMPAMMEYGRKMILYESEKFNRKIFYQQKEFNHALSLTFARRFAYDIINAELSGYYNITSDEIMAMIKIGWSIRDNLTLSVGGSIMNGPEGTLFEKTGKVMNGAFCDFTVRF